jgi:hypothetical protein
MKLHPGEAEFHVDSWADMTKIVVAFHNFMNVPKNGD